MSRRLASSFSPETAINMATTLSQISVTEDTGHDIPPPIKEGSFYGTSSVIVNNRAAIPSKHNPFYIYSGDKHGHTNEEIVPTPPSSPVTSSAKTLRAGTKMEPSFYINGKLLPANSHEVQQYIKAHPGQFPPPYICTICSKTMNGRTPWIQHQDSTQHKKNMETDNLIDQ